LEAYSPGSVDIVAQYVVQIVKSYAIVIKVTFKDKLPDGIAAVSTTLVDFFMKTPESVIFIAVDILVSIFRSVIYAVRNVTQA